MFCYYIVTGFEIELLPGETLKLVPIFFDLFWFAAFKMNEDLLVDLICYC